MFVFDGKDEDVWYYRKQCLFARAMMEWKETNKRLGITNTQRNKSKFCGDCVYVCAAGDENSSGYVRCSLDGSSVVLGQYCPKNKFNLRFYD